MVEWAVEGHVVDGGGWIATYLTFKTRKKRNKKLEEKKVGREGVRRTKEVRGGEKG